MGFEQEALEELFANVAGKRSMMQDRFVLSGRGETFVLRRLRRIGTSTPSQLAAAMHSSSGRISAVLGSLQKKGLITREIDPDDRRNIHVLLTQEGLRQTERGDEEMRSVAYWIFSQMGERRTQEFVDLVTEFVTYMSICHPGKPRPTAREVAEAFAGVRTSRRERRPVSVRRRSGTIPHRSRRLNSLRWERRY